MPRLTQAPPPGVVRNATPEATPGRWWDQNLTRWRGGVLQPVGGNVLLPGSPVANPIRDVLTWHDNSYSRWAAMGTDAALWAYNFDTQVLYNITPASVPGLEAPGAVVGYGTGNYSVGNYGTARSPSTVGPSDVSGNLGDMWSMDTFGQDLVIVPTQDGHLFHWSPATPATLPAVVAAAPVNNRGVIVTDQRQAVLLGAGGDPRLIAWSDQEAYTIWAPDVTNLAGSKRLVTQAKVQSALKVASGILIFTSNDAHLMTYVGPPFAYGIIQVGAGCGPLSLRAPVSIGSFAAWPSLQQWWTYSGNVQPVACDVKDWFFSVLNRDYHGRLFGSVNPQFAELWFDWPDEGATECNRYLAFNFGMPGQPHWMIGQRTRTAADRLGVMDHPILAGPYGTQSALYLHEYGWTENGAARASTGEIYAESGAITLGEGDSRYHVRQIVTDGVTDPTNPAFGFRLFLKEQPQDTVETDTGLHSNIHSGLVDIRCSGRSARMRIEAIADVPWALGRPRLELRPAGRR